jgi:glycosyltransferase involved in cell wall biosynthesis
MCSNKKVTIIIPTYNRRDWIGECLDSVLGQTYGNIETIVVDDCSTDGTVEWLRSEEKYSKVVVHQQEKNGGASIARNTAIGMANGKLIVFIDSDDILLPGHIETAVRYFEKHDDLGLFCCDSRMIDAEGRELFGGKTWHQSLAEAKGYDIKTGFRSLKDVFSYSNCFPGFTLRREVFAELGGFDQSIFPADDYDLALRVAASRFKVFYLHEPLCLRREHDGQCSGIENAVKTQVKLIEALERVAMDIPDVKFLKDRFADVKMALGISELKEGKTAKGLQTIAGAIVSSHRQLLTLARIAKRKLGGATAGKP